MRILIVEDDCPVAQSHELMLKSERFNPYITDLGHEAIDLGKLYDYDIILLDLNLPDIPATKSCGASPCPDQDAGPDPVWTDRGRGAGSKVWAMGRRLPDQAVSQGRARRPRAGDRASVRWSR